MTLGTVDQGADPDKKQSKTKLSESTRLHVQEVSDEKNKATRIVVSLMKELDEHERTKAFLMMALQGKGQDFIFDTPKQKRSIMKNARTIAEQIEIGAEKQGISTKKIKEALLEELEIDSIQRSFTEESYDLLVPYELEQAIENRDVALIVSELNKDPELKQEVVDILTEQKELQIGVIGIRRMSKSTEARQHAMKIYQAGLLDEFLKNQ